MPKTTDTTLLEALTALAEQETEGPYTCRLEAVCDVTAANAVAAVAREEMGGKVGAQSKAIRALLKDGAKYRAQRLARKARRA
jgi:hypothetical protein